MSGRSPSRQVRRAEERVAQKKNKATAHDKPAAPSLEQSRTPPRGKEFATEPRPLRWFEVLWTLAFLVGTVGTAIIACAGNVTALKAVVDLGWYCWLALCAVSAVALALTVVARWRGISVPIYFRLVLLVGVTCGVFTWSKAWRVITSNRADVQLTPAGAHIDLRDQVISDTSYAERNLRDSNFSGATFDHVDLDSADLSESDLRDATFRKVNFAGVDLCGVDLRGADLRGALRLPAVKDWSFVFYNDKTRLPASDSYILPTSPGPIPDNGHDLLYMCKANVVKRLHG
jgi:hypothetical protein